MVVVKYSDIILIEFFLAFLFFCVKIIAELAKVSGDIAQLARATDF